GAADQAVRKSRGRRRADRVPLHGRRRGDHRSDALDRRRLDRGVSSHGQVVLVLQGGGALGAYQGGVFEALHEAGLEPDWVIGTSIGAINGALIAANEPQARLERLREFWARIVQDAPLFTPAFWPGMGEM